MSGRTYALCAAPRFKDSAAVRRILELRGWSPSKKPDYVITLGGDGSVLYAESKYPGTPIIAFKTGLHGFLGCEEIENIEEVLKSVEKGKITIETRKMVEFLVDGKRGEALNEISVTETEPGKALRLNIAIDSQSLGSFICDGVLLSTPTGSTGYNLSCGGPVVEPSAPVLVLTFINPHLSKLKSLVLPDSRKVTVSFSRAGEKIAVVADGLKTTAAKPSEKVTLRLSRKEAKLVRVKESYYPSLESLLT
jgi:NAD+ kinase